MHCKLIKYFYDREKKIYISTVDNIDAFLELPSNFWDSIDKIYPYGQGLMIFIAGGI